MVTARKIAKAERGHTLIELGVVMAVAVILITAVATYRMGAVDSARYEATGKEIDTLGLALSGGGYRSAIYGYGVLQGLHEIGSGGHCVSPYANDREPFANPEVFVRPTSAQPGAYRPGPKA